MAPTPNGDNVLLGSGDVWFNRKNNDGTYVGFRYLGNVSKLEITPTVTTVEKNSSSNAARAVIAQAITDTKMELDMTLDEFTPENVALALLGDVSTYSQASATKTAATLGAAALGYAIDTGFQNITVTDVKKGATTFVRDVDYDVDEVSGMITPLIGGAIVDDDALTWDGSVPMIAGKDVDGLSSGKIEGAVRFRASDDQVGPRALVDIYRVSMNPNTAIPLLGTAFAEINIKGEVLADSTRAKGKQFSRTRYLPAAA